MKALQRILVMLLWCVALFASHARADTITYFHNDLLGSPAAATNESGTVIWREAYSGYGERIKNEAPSAPNKVWYTSRHQDADTGLVYMGARYYDPALGRFLSVDAVGFNEQNVHSFNRYAYANNNPYKFKDPDGNSPLSVLLLEVAKQTGAGYLLGVAADSVSQYAAFGEVSLSLAATSSSAIAGGESGLLSGAVAGAFKAYAGATSAAKASATTEDFFAGARYTDKVVGQMKQADLHAFPESVKAFQDAGQVSKLTGGDGVARELLRIPGEYRGKQGAFEFIKEADGAINHRLFKPTLGE